MNARSFDLNTGVVLNPNARPGAYDAKAPTRDYGTKPIITRDYNSKDAADLEWEKMWTKVWTLAGFACDLTAVGDYFRYDLGRESFFVVRTAKTRIQAFYNVCPHRGNQIVTSDFGAARGCFQCAFHGWTFELNGKLRKISERRNLSAGSDCSSSRTQGSDLRCLERPGVHFHEPNTGTVTAIPRHNCQPFETVPH